MDHIHENATTVMIELQELATSASTTRQVAEVARQRLDRIAASQAYLEDNSHRIAFIGQIGVGKSSMIGVLAKLLVGDAPTDRTSLKDNSVLAVGAGGTTVCEVHIRAANQSEQGRIGLIIEPLSVEEMSDEIRFFAQDEWARRRAINRPTADDDSEPTPREVQRVIRNMTGFQERAEYIQEGGQRKRRDIDPLADVINNHNDADSLANFLIQRAGLLSRRDTSWWWDDSPDGYREMKRWFADINHGRAPTAMLPQCITLVVADPLPDVTGGLDLELIDTRGFDGQLEARADLQGLFRDPRTLTVICSPFKEAPGEAVRSLLRTILGDAELRQAAQRILLVLMDHGDAEQVNGADGDRKSGQLIKRRECCRSLESTGLEAFASEGLVCSFDTLKDDRAAVVSMFDMRLRAVRDAVLEKLNEEIRDAGSFLDNIENARVELARAEVDRRLCLTLQANRPQGVPLRDSLSGLYDAIREWRFASQVLASCRRGGSYVSMDAYAAVRAGASKAVTEWLASLHAAMISAFKTLQHDEELAEVREHIRLRQSQYHAGYIGFIRDYADGVQDDVESKLRHDPVWAKCAEEWGRGPGFKNRVVHHLDRWSRNQTLSAHLNADPSDVLPIECPDT